MNGWTHFSPWRLWFTCKAAATAWAPSSEIWLDPRLQNVREQTRNILQIHKPCNKSNCKIPTHHSRNRNQVDENLVYYLIWHNVSKYQIYSLICSDPIFFTSLSLKWGGDFTRTIIHYVTLSRSLSEATDTLYNPYFHFCYELALET